MIHTQLLRDDNGRFIIRTAKNQQDPILGVGSGQLNSMPESIWEAFSKAQEANNAFQEVLKQMYCSDWFPFEGETTKVKKEKIASALRVSKSVHEWLRKSDEEMRLTVGNASVQELRTLKAVLRLLVI